MPGDKRPCVPEAKDTDYTFAPNPPDPMPPILAHEFKTRFYGCHPSRTSHKHLFGLAPCSKKCKRFLAPSGALDRIPKRNKWLNVVERRREIFWGLLAVHRPSSFRVILYHIVILIGPFIFSFLWLFLWGHPGDLQNAVIPFSMVAVLLSMFWFPLIQKH